MTPKTSDLQLHGHYNTTVSLLCNLFGVVLVLNLYFSMDFYDFNHPGQRGNSSKC